MNVSISLLLSGIGAKDAAVLDYRETYDDTPFDVAFIQGLAPSDAPDLDPHVLYVADKAALAYLAGFLSGMSVAFAGDMPAAEDFAPLEDCRVVCVPGFASTSELLNRLVAAQRAIDDVDARLIWASLEKDPLSAMLPILAEWVHEPVLATDVDDVLVAHAAPKGLAVTDEVFRHIIERNCIMADVPLYDTFLSSLPAGEAPAATVPLVRVPGSDREYLNATVMRDGRPLVYLLMSNEGGAFPVHAADALLSLKHIVEQAVRAGSPMGFPPPDKDSCVRRLLEHIFVREEIIVGYLRKRGWSIDDRYYCVLVQPEDPGAARTLPFLARQLRSGIMRDAVVLVHGEEVACVVHADEHPYDVARLTEALGAPAARFSVRMGVSCPFRDFRELRRYYDSCRTAISYGVQEAPPRAVSFFETYAPRHLEKALFGRTINEALLNAQACDLKGYDDEQGGDLLNTLLVYLECGQNKSLAARQLYIHRNTLIYRLGTIERVTGMSLAELDADRLYHLMYTCRYLTSRG